MLRLRVMRIFLEDEVILGLFIVLDNQIERMCLLQWELLRYHKS